MKPTRKHARKGSLLAVSMITAVVLLAVGSSYVNMTTTNIKVAHANFTHHALLNPLESGADNAMLMLSKYLAVAAPSGVVTADGAAVWIGSGWQAHGTGYSKVIDERAPLGNGLTAQYKVTVQHVPTVANPGYVPFAIIEATTNQGASKSNSVYSRQVVINLKTRSLFDNGMVARNVIDLKGNTYSIDSYSSTKGSYNAATNRGDNATVASLAVLNGINASGGTVFGNLAVTPKGEDPTADMKGATVYGTDSISPYGAGTRLIDPAHVTKDFTADFPLKTWPNTSSTTVTSSIVVSGTKAKPIYTVVGSTNPLSPTTLVLDKAAAALSNLINIKGHVVFINSDPAIGMSMSGNGGLVIASDGSLKIYTAGNVKISGNGFINVDASGTGRPVNCQIYGTNPNIKGQSIDISGNGAYSGIVYAPNAEITMNGGGSAGVVNGALIGYNVTCNGGVSFHYDEALAVLGEPGYSLQSWIELQGADRIALKAYGL